VITLLLQEWATENEPSTNMKFYSGYWGQIMFVRDRIPGLFWDDCLSFDEMCERLTVISDHTSKSIKLPVYQLELQDVIGLTLTLRDNFHGWVVSVKSAQPIICDFFDTIDPKDNIGAIYCEGFPEEVVYKSFDENNSQFTVRCHDDYTLYTFLYILRSHFKNEGLLKLKKY
jgi:hypothetical protein